MRGSIKNSIIKNCSAFFAAQLAIFGAAALAWGIGWGLCATFAALSLAFHAAVAFGLASLSGDFVIEETGEELSRVNLANQLSLARISTLPTILFLLIASRSHPMLPYVLAVTALAFLTDLLDGKVSRRLHQVTRIGRILDSTSDYCLLGVITIVFLVFSLIPAWIFCVIIFRLAFQAVCMLVIGLKEGRVTPESSFLGKLAIASVMVLYAAELFALVISRGPWDLAFRAVEWAVSAIMAVSVADKALLMLRHLRPDGKQD
jgi:cardiolipin synthase (CMP-forming)